MLVKAKSITFTFKEGVHGFSVGDGEVVCEGDNPWDSAKMQLRIWSDYAPRGGAYDKTDFHIEYEDGFIYEGRYDLQHWSYAAVDLEGHIISNVATYSGCYCPPHLRLDNIAQLLDFAGLDVEKESFMFLHKYEIGRQNNEVAEEGGS